MESLEARQQVKLGALCDIRFIILAADTFLAAKHLIYLCNGSSWYSLMYRQARAPQNEEGISSKICLPE